MVIGNKTKDKNTLYSKTETVNFKAISIEINIVETR